MSRRKHALQDLNDEKQVKFNLPQLRSSSKSSITITPPVKFQSFRNRNVKIVKDDEIRNDIATTSNSSISIFKTQNVKGVEKSAKKDEAKNQDNLKIDLSTLKNARVQLIDIKSVFNIDLNKVNVNKDLVLSSRKSPVASKQSVNLKSTPRTSFKMALQKLNDQYVCKRQMKLTSPELTNVEVKSNLKSKDVDKKVVKEVNKKDSEALSLRRSGRHNNTSESTSEIVFEKNVEVQKRKNINLPIRKSPRINESKSNSDNESSENEPKGKRVLKTGQESSKPKSHESSEASIYYSDNNESPKSERQTKKMSNKSKESSDRKSAESSDDSSYSCSDNESTESERETRNFTKKVNRSSKRKRKTSESSEASLYSSEDESTDSEVQIKRVINQSRKRVKKFDSSSNDEEQEEEEEKYSEYESDDDDDAYSYNKKVPSKSVRRSPRIRSTHLSDKVPVYTDDHNGESAQVKRISGFRACKSGLVNVRKRLFNELYERMQKSKSKPRKETNEIVDTQDSSSSVSEIPMNSSSKSNEHSISDEIIPCHVDGQSEYAPEQIILFQSLNDKREYSELSKGVYATIVDYNEGIIRLKPLAKTTKNEHDSDIRYYVQCGNIKLDINECVIELGVGDAFKVPKRNTYQIRNASKKNYAYVLFKFDRYDLPLEEV